jgi:hypothetical protein
MEGGILNSAIAPFSVSSQFRPELKLRANRLSPLKWTEILRSLAKVLISDL